MYTPPLPKGAREKNTIFWEFFSCVLLFLFPSPFEMVFFSCWSSWSPFCSCEGTFSSRRERVLIMIRTLFLLISVNTMQCNGGQASQELQRCDAKKRILMIRNNFTWFQSSPCCSHHCAEFNWWGGRVAGRQPGGIRAGRRTWGPTIFYSERYWGQWKIFPPLYQWKRPLVCQQKLGRYKCFCEELRRHTQSTEGQLDLLGWEEAES